MVGEAREVPRLLLDATRLLAARLASQQVAWDRRAALLCPNVDRLVELYTEGVEHPDEVWRAAAEVVGSVVALADEYETRET